MLRARLRASPPYATAKQGSRQRKSGLCHRGRARFGPLHLLQSLTSVNSHRDQACWGCGPGNCRRFGTLVSSSLLASVNRCQQSQGSVSGLQLSRHSWPGGERSKGNPMGIKNRAEHEFTTVQPDNRYPKLLSNKIASLPKLNRRTYRMLGLPRKALSTKKLKLSPSCPLRFFNDPLRRLLHFAYDQGRPWGGKAGTSQLYWRPELTLCHQI